MSDFKFISFYQLLLNTATTEMKRLKSGFLLKEIFDRFKNKSQSTLSPDRSLWMYFGHETTIANMLNSLGIFTEVNIFIEIKTFFDANLSEFNDTLYILASHTNICVLYFLRTISMCRQTVRSDLLQKYYGKSQISYSDQYSELRFNVSIAQIV